MITQLHYTSSGEGLPFVFQHGLGANKEQAQGLLAGLLEVKLISMDCPGHGLASLHDAKAPSFKSYSEEVIRMLDELEIDSAVLGGISMGAGISTHLALHYPDRVKGLVLVRPAWLDTPRPENLEILLEVADCLEQEDSLERFKKKPSYREMNEELPLAAASVLGMFSRQQLNDTPAVLRNMVNDAPFDSLLELESIEKPCLLVVNHDDPLHPHAFGYIFQQYIKGSKVKEVTSRYVDDGLHGREVREVVSGFLLDNFTM